MSGGKAVLMEENMIDDYRTSGMTEDEFGVGLKLFLAARFAFYAIGVFMIIGALIYIALGIGSMDEILSNATGVSATKIDDNFGGYQMLTFVQAGYTIASLICVALTYIRRSRLFAGIDIGLYVVLLILTFVMGGAGLLTNGSAWFLYLFIFTPVYSFIALFAGKHWRYMANI